MRSLYLRIWLTVIVTLALFAGASGWLVQRHLDQERVRNQAVINERIAAWGDLIQRSLPAAAAPPDVQAEALKDWSQRLRVPMALQDEQGHRIAASDSFVRREGDKQLMHVAIYQIKLDDGRSLFVMRPNMLKPPPGNDPSGPPDEDIGGFGTEHHPQVSEARGAPPFWFAGVVPRGVSPGLSLLALVVVLFLAIAVGAYPFIRRLTRRLETLKRGVEAFGQGALDRRVPVEGRDEVATLATSFNLAAERVEALVRSHKSLLANASHELRSPLARLKMATSMLADSSPEQREHLRSEINTDIAELDGLVDEVLLASRLEAAPEPDHLESVDLLALAVEEGARVDASVDGAGASVRGEERLLRRALRNLLENARRYGGGEIRVDLEDKAAAGVEIRVTDNGPGVPEAFRERIFEPFFRLPGHAERAGGVGLGLALVRQIVERHHGRIRCVRPPEGGGCFVINLPAAARA
ncbi:sensor histidine kinase [Scleromatobacter humisilvae]|uniref:histidine kinase n=1 Tax=Scleromatobacter humisilvae TaxID=2897159 RepID=A0A9X1YQE6_9BURK|nr:HAMP domain-containing sensor histidine kinase [Scleromatobacter humisilvae]MCK9689233.1 HAMP domain-containing histidine kinase [Scleromatobacter humisilvae]